MDDEDDEEDPSMNELIAAAMGFNRSGRRFDEGRPAEDDEEKGEVEDDGLERSTTVL